MALHDESIAADDLGTRASAKEKIREAERNARWCVSGVGGSLREWKHLYQEQYSSSIHVSAVLEDVDESVR
jgi:hypothetical protein